MDDINVKIRRNKNGIIIYIGKQCVGKVLRNRIEAVVIRDQLGKIMADRNISQSDLARLMGTSRQWVGQIIHGDWGITINTIRSLEKALNVKFERST